VEWPSRYRVSPCVVPLPKIIEAWPMLEVGCSFTSAVEHPKHRKHSSSLKVRLHVTSCDCKQGSLACHVQVHTNTGNVSRIYTVHQTI
jgi:hypothetical protein